MPNKEQTNKQVDYIVSQTKDGITYIYCICSPVHQINFCQHPNCPFTYAQICQISETTYDSHKTIKLIKIFITKQIM